MPQDQERQLSLDEFKEKARQRYGIPKGLWESVRGQESGGDVNAVSETGVRGEFQVTKKTARAYGLNRDDPFHQVAAAAKNLREGYDHYSDVADDNKRWLAATSYYYYGPGGMKPDGAFTTHSKDGVSNPAEHVSMIEKRWREYEDSQAGATTQPAAQPSTPARPAATPQQPKPAPVRSANEDLLGRPDPLGYDNRGRGRSRRLTEMSTNFEALKRQGAKNAAAEIASEIKREFGDLMEVGADAGGWPYIKPKGSSGLSYDPNKLLPERMPTPEAASRQAVESWREGQRPQQQAEFARKPMHEQIAERSKDAFARGGGHVSKMARQTLGFIAGQADLNPLTSFRDFPSWREGEEARMRDLEARSQARPSSLASEVGEGIIEAGPAAAAAIGGTMLTGGGALAAMLVGGGMSAAGADWSDPTRALTQTAIGAIAPAAGGKFGQKVGGAVASRLTSPTAQSAARAGGELIGGGAGNVLGRAGEVGAFEGRMLTRREATRESIIGAALNAPGAAAVARSPASITSGVDRSIIESAAGMPARAPITVTRQGRQATFGQEIDPQRINARGPVEREIRRALDRFAASIEQINRANLDPATRAERIAQARAALQTERVAARQAGQPAETPPITPDAATTPAEAPQLPPGVRIVRQGEPIPPRQQGERQFPMDVELPDGGVETVLVIAPGRANEAALRPVVEQALRPQPAQPVTAAQPEAVSTQPPPRLASAGEAKAAPPMRPPARSPSVAREAPAIPFTQLGPEGLRTVRTPEGAVVAQPSSLPSRKLLPPASTQEMQAIQPDAPPTRRLPAPVVPDAPVTQEMPAIRQRIAAENAPTAELPAPPVRRTAEIPPRVMPPIRQTANSPRFAPTNRIMTGAGDELPRYAGRQLEGQPVERPPIRAFHGTDADFDAFDFRLGEPHFTRDRSAAEQFARGRHGKQQRIVEADIDIQNPAGPDEWKAALDRASGGNPRGMAVRDLQRQGYDGVITDHEIIPFTPEQVKIAPSAQQARAQGRPLPPPAPPVPAGRPQRPPQQDVIVPSDRRAMVGEGRRVQGEIEAGRGEKGEFGKIAQQMFKSTEEGGQKGFDSFFNDPYVKGAVGLSPDASMGEVRAELKREMARAMGVKAGEISLTQVNPATWAAWARQKGLPRETRAKMRTAIERYQKGVISDIEKTSPAEGQQPSEPVRAVREAAAAASVGRTRETVADVGPERPVDRAMRQARERRQQREETATRFIEQHGEKPFKAPIHGGDRGQHMIVHRSTRPGEPGWQFTRFDDQGPMGHTVFENFREGLLDQMLHEKLDLSQVATGSLVRRSVPPQAAESTGREIGHGKFGKVTEAADQSNVRKGYMRVIDADGKTHIIQHPRTRGNREAAFVRGAKTEAPDIVSRMTQINPRAATGAPVQVSKLRAAFPDMNKADFDAAMAKLNEEGRIALHRHDHPASLKEADRANLVKIGNDYFTAATLREGAGAPKPAETKEQAKVRETAEETARRKVMAEQLAPRAEAFGRNLKFDDIPVAAPKDLDADSRGVETRFRNYLANNFGEAVNRYIAEFGKEINTDNVRELSDDYNASNEARSKYSPAVHEPSSWFAKELYKMMLAEKPDANHDPLVFFTAGGTGAGKTSTITDSEAMAAVLGEKLARSQMVMDGNLNNAKKAIQKIDQALAAGKKVVIAATYRDPIVSWRKGVLPRAEGKGRAVPVDIHVETHSQMRDSLLGLLKHYANDPRVEIQFIDNTGGKGQAQPSKSVALFKEISDTKALREQLVKETNEAYEKGEITQRVYQGSLGGGHGAHTEEAGGGLRRGQGNGRAPELQPNSRRLDRPKDTAQTAEDRGRSIPEPAAPGRSARGDESTLTIPRGADIPIRYEVRELADLQASHDPHTFQKNPKYPYVNDRDYTSPVNRTDVEENTKAGKFKPNLVINDDPTAAGGPPIIRPHGAVLGGNSRTMMIARVYKNHPADAQKYRDLLKAKAQRSFGIDPAELDGFKEPVLVRVDDSSGGTQKLITDLNIMPGKAMSSTEAAAARAKSMPAETMQFLADRLAAEGPEGTLAQALEGPKGVKVINRLIEDGIIPVGERNRYLSDQGNLSPAAKTEIEQMLLSRLFRDQGQMKNTPPEMRNKLVRVAPHLGKMAGTEWDVSNLIPNAVEAVAAAKNQKLNLSQLNQRGSLFGESAQYSPEELALANLFMRNGPVQIEKTFRRYAAEFDNAQRGSSLFGEPMTQKDAFNDVFKPEQSRSGSLFDRGESKGHIMGFGPGVLQGMFKNRKPPKSNPSKADIESAGLGSALGNIARGAGNEMRTALTVLDFGAPGVQGIWFMMSHPIKSASSGAKMFRSLSRAQSDAIDAEIAFHPLRRLGEDAGLFLATSARLKGNRAGGEEAYRGYLAEAPGIRAFERTYRTYLDTVRMSVWESYVKSLTKAGHTWASNPKAYKDAASFINIATGRGQLKKGGMIEKASDLLGAGIFAPRNLIANFQLLDPVRYARMEPAARKLALRDSLTTLGAMMGTAMLLKQAGVDVNLDLEDPDFMVARWGDTRYDLTFGKKQQVQFVARLIAGAYRQATGEGNLPGKDPLSVTGKFAESKASPLLSAAMTLPPFGRERTFEGKRFDEMSKGEIAWETAPVPIVMKDLVDAYRLEGKKGVAKTLPAVVGARVSTYPDRAKAAFVDTPAELRAEQKRAGETRSYLAPRRAARGSEEKDEAPAAFAARRARANEWTTKYGLALVQSSAYKKATAKEQQAARAYLKSTIAEQSGSKRPSLWLFAPGHIFETVRESERERRRKAGDLQ